eukprot:g23368.t1
MLVLALLAFCLVGKADLDLQWDAKGYVMFCPCMGRLGNQMDYFLGMLRVAKELDRTLVLPHFIFYQGSQRKLVPYEDFFDTNLLSPYARVITFKAFRQNFAASHWQPEHQVVACYGDPNDQSPCHLRNGQPATDYWDNLGFFPSRHLRWGRGYSAAVFVRHFPPAKVPVLALPGAVTPFPLLPRDQPLQSLMQFSEPWRQAIEALFSAAPVDGWPGRPVLALHLRNGGDWERSCQHLDSNWDGSPPYMSSGQCADSGPVSASLCFPLATSIVTELSIFLRHHPEVRTVLVSTDSDPMLSALSAAIAAVPNSQAKVVTNVPALLSASAASLPPSDSSWKSVLEHDHANILLDLAALSSADFFIGNCISSFTAFAKRARDFPSRMQPAKRPTWFWGQSEHWFRGDEDSAAGDETEDSEESGRSRRRYHEELR